MKRLTLQKIGSVTHRLGLRPQAVLSSRIPAEAGIVVACRVQSSRHHYHTLENPNGRMVPLRPGDSIAGALGDRHALHGFAGQVPDQVQPGDRLQLLNLGGVIGCGATATPKLGQPFQLEVLGAVMDFPHPGHRAGVPAHIGRAALPKRNLPHRLPPVLAFLGTSMDSGKTTAASAVVSQLADRGKKVACGKLTGVSLMRDMLLLQDHGASVVASFTDFGVVTTNEENAVPTGYSLLAYLIDHEPDVVVLEMGDGLFGTYGVQALLQDAAFRSCVTQWILCAQDPVGAWGAVRHLQEAFQIRPTVISGPITDTEVGTSYCRNALELPAYNAMKSPQALAGEVQP